MYSSCLEWLYYVFIQQVEEWLRHTNHDLHCPWRSPFLSVSGHADAHWYMQDWYVCISISIAVQLAYHCWHHIIIFVFVILCSFTSGRVCWFSKVVRKSTGGELSSIVPRNTRHHCGYFYWTLPVVSQLLHLMNLICPAVTLFISNCRHTLCFVSVLIIVQVYGS
jgi:hypothetical protein